MSDHQGLSEEEMGLSESVKRLRAWEAWASNHYIPPDANPYHGEAIVTTQCCSRHVQDKEEVVAAYLAEQRTRELRSLGMPNE